MKDSLSAQALDSTRRSRVCLATGKSKICGFLTSPSPPTSPALNSASTGPAPFGDTSELPCHSLVSLGLSCSEIVVLSCSEIIVVIVGLSFQQLSMCPPPFFCFFFRSSKFPLIINFFFRLSTTSVRPQRRTFVAWRRLRQQCPRRRYERSWMPSKTDDKQTTLMMTD